MLYEVITVYISPSTIINDDKETFYVVRLETERPYLGDDKKMPLIAGMTVSVDILTGKKSVLQYLLKPIRITSYNVCYTKLLRFCFS